MTNKIISKNIIDGKAKAYWRQTFNQTNLFSRLFFSNYYTYISKFLLIQYLDILLQNSILLLPGVFTCGPCPVRAIRNGDLYLGYDTKFLFAEVNGDRVFWTVDSEGNMTPVFKDIDVVGKFMSTKAVNTISRDDVTSKYKHETGIRVLTHFLHSFSKFLNTRF